MSGGFYARCPKLPPRKPPTGKPAAEKMTYMESVDNFSKPDKLFSQIPLGVSDFDFDLGQSVKDVEIYVGAIEELELEIGVRERVRTCVLVHDNFATLKGMFDAEQLSKDDLTKDIELLRRQRNRVMAKHSRMLAVVTKMTEERDINLRANALRQNHIDDLETTIPTRVPGVKRGRKKKRTGSSVASSQIGESASQVGEEVGEEVGEVVGAGEVEPLGDDAEEDLVEQDLEPAAD